MSAGSERRYAGARLIVDLAAIAANYRLLRDRVAPAECAAVVKADAYGLGAAKVTPALLAAGCRTFFVAHVDEGIAVRKALHHAAGSDPAGDEARILVLNGAPRGAEGVLLEHRLGPVLNSLGDVEAWRTVAGAGVPAAALHVDTGMSRLGLPADELALLERRPERLEGVELACVMSHLACADEPDHQLNAAQRGAFQRALAALPRAPASLANSSGVFLGRAYHLDLVRPGIALYGASPVPGRPNPMTQVVRLQGRILQVREIDSGRSVGYGATHRAARAERIATVAVGYADGYLRSLGNIGKGRVAGVLVPVVGRVSMDLITFDITDVPGHQATPGDAIELIGDAYPVDAMAADAGTISYEILTRLGRRFERVYTDGG